MFSMILPALHEHLAPTPLELAQHELHCCNQMLGKSVTTYLAALRITAQHCNFTALNTSLRGHFVFGLHNEKEKRRLLAKKVTLASTMEEAVATKALDQKANLPPRSNTTATRREPVHQKMTGDDAEGQDVTEKDILRLRANAG